MTDQEFSELLARILEGEASEEDRVQMQAWLNGHGEGREQFAEQITMDGLLGIALEDEVKRREFHEKLVQRLADVEKRAFTERVGEMLLRNRRWIALIVGPALGVFAWFGLLSMLGDVVEHPYAACWTGAVAVLCATWWILEPIPIAATSLIPMALLPLVGVIDEATVAKSYGNHLVILFLSGFMLSRAMEHSGAHRRLALGMVKLIGASSGRRLVLGFMIASAVLSMWISNTATALMLLPVAIAVIDQCENRKIATPLLLGVAYASSIGGIATPIGTPPNAVYLAQADLLVEEGIMASAPGFLGWMKIGLPIMSVMLALSWLWLTRGRWPQTRIRLAKIGAWKQAEVRVVLVFGVTAVLWMTRSAPNGGWSEWIGTPSVKDSTVGLLAVIALFIIPCGDIRGQKLLTWETAVSIPWGILILFGGGIALGEAFGASGLSSALASNMSHLSGLPILAMILLVAFSITFLTEVTSNTATATVIMPLLAATATAAEIRPELLMIPAALSASFAFMLPVATPPNAVVYAVGEFSIGKMAREGIVINLMGTIVIALVCWLMLA